MADQTTSATDADTQDDKDQTQDQAATQDTATDDGLSDAGRDAIRKERRAAREAIKRANELEGRLKEFEDRDKTEAEKVTERLQAAETRIPSLEAENMRLKVALDKGLVGDRAWVADRLRGDTVEALEKDADELLAQFKPPDAKDFDAGARSSGGGTVSMNDLMRRAAGRT